MTVHTSISLSRFVKTPYWRAKILSFSETDFGFYRVSITDFIKGKFIPVYTMKAYGR